MAQTCHQCRGRSDNYNESNLKRCSGCQKVFYCSTACQKYDWVVHIFECKPNRAINTADHLALAVRRNVLPEHTQTCKDYGFYRAATDDDKANLLGLYTDMIDILKISPKTIHNWRVRGVLVDEIKAAFHKLPERSRGGYFLWFLLHQHVVAQAGQPLPPVAWYKEDDAMLVHAWTFIGGSEEYTPKAIRAAVNLEPLKEQHCFWLYVLLLSAHHPPPGDDYWIDFGFASCASQEEETALSAQYQRLITMCTFREFCNAYTGRGLLDLFRSKGLAVANVRYFGDLLFGVSGMLKSVWHLKNYVQTEDAAAADVIVHPAVIVDYGFMHCENDEEKQQLRRVYKAFFVEHRGNPLALHEAAIQGNLLGFLSTVMPDLRDPKLERLMKNPYPLPDV